MGGCVSSAKDNEPVPAKPAVNNSTARSSPSQQSRSRTQANGSINQQQNGAVNGTTTNSSPPQQNQRVERPLPVPQNRPGLGLPVDLLDGLPERYKFVRDVGVGMYGFVILAQEQPSGRYVAIKFLQRGKTLGKMIEREILSHRISSAHPHVVQFYEVFLTPRYLAISMEFAAGGDLFEYTRQNGGCLMEEEARWLFQQLISAVSFCHNVGVVNRDIKLENALLCTGLDYPILKLCDFGYSKNEKMDSGCKTAAGTLEYVAPETVMNLKTYDGKAVDVWSCGIFLYVLLQGAYPFHKKPGDCMAFQRMMKGTFDFKVPVSPDCEDLLRRMLVVDPEKRLTMQEVMDHQWCQTDLPEQLAEINKVAPKPPNFKQSDEEIRQIVDEAQVTTEPGRAQEFL